MLTCLNVRSKVEESEIIEIKSKLFFYEDQNKNLLISQRPKVISTLKNIIF